MGIVFHTAPLDTVAYSIYTFEKEAPLEILPHPIQFEWDFFYSSSNLTFRLYQQQLHQIHWQGIYPPALQI